MRTGRIGRSERSEQAERTGRTGRGGFGRVVGALLVALTLLLAACTDTLPETPMPGGVPPGLPASGIANGTPSGVTATADVSGADKVDDVYRQLLAVYGAMGLDAARQFARTQGLLTAADEVRMTLVLDTNDPMVIQGTALAVGRLGGRVTATFNDQIELVVPLQLLADYSRQAAQPAQAGQAGQAGQPAQPGQAAQPGMGNFFGALADFRHVRDIRRTPMAQTTAAAADPAPDTGNGPGPGFRAVPAIGGRSEGVDLTEAAHWQAAGFTGKGVKVGVIDVGFTNYPAVLGTARVTARSFREDSKLDAPPGFGTMHGAACAEIVREMAPDADLYLAAAGDTPGGFITALHWLTRTAGVSVISTSLGFSGDYPTDGTSELAKAADEARAAGVVFVKSAGNNALQHYRAGAFTDGDGNGEHDFPGAAQRNALKLTVGGGGALHLWLNWNDWAKPHVAYTLSVSDAAGAEVAHSIDDSRRTGKRPVQEIVASVPAGTYFAHVRKLYADDPNLPLTLIASPGTALELTVADDSVTVPGDAAGAVTVGAVNWQSGRVERFSSRGPTLDGRPKPDFGGPDGVTSIAFGLVGSPQFNGTSAAAPHVAGAVALYQGVYPAATPDDVLRYLATHSVMPPDTLRGDSAVGAGLLNLGAAPLPGPPGVPPPPSSGATGADAPLLPPATRVLATTGDAFADDFTSPASGLSPTGYTSGTYRLVAVAGSLTTQVYPVNVTAPVATFTVQTRPVSGAADAPMGLIVRSRARDDYLLFVVTNDGAFNVYAQLNGSLHALLDSWKTSAAITRGGPNTLSVATTGTHFVFRVNGQPLSAVEITDVWATGAFGFAAGGGRDAGGEIAFSSYRVAIGQ